MLTHALFCTGFKGQILTDALLRETIHASLFLVYECYGNETWNLYRSSLAEHFNMKLFLLTLSVLYLLCQISINSLNCLFLLHF